MDNQAILAEIPRLRRYARAMLGNRAAADDLVQDTLERAWSRLKQWQPGSNLRSWLFGIMHNLRVDQLRRAPPFAQSLEDVESELPIRPTQTDGLELVDLEAALHQLPEEQRAVILLVALEELSYAEIATLLNIRAGTVMSRLARGREHLRQIMNKEHPETRLRIVR